MKKVLHLINDATPSRGGAQKILAILREDELNQGKETFSFSKYRNDKIQNQKNFIGGRGWIIKVLRASIKIRPEWIIIHSRFYLPLVPFFTLFGIKSCFYAHANYKSAPYLFKLFKTTSYIAVSETVQENLIGAGVPIKKVNLIKNPITPSAIAFPKYPSTSINLSYVGGLHAWKGVLNLIDYISISDLDIRLIIIGDGPLKHQIIDRIKLLPSNIKIELLGEVNNPFSRIEHCHINVMPSIEEGFGLVAIESMYHGRVLIHSDAPALTEICRNDRLSFSFSHSSPSSFSIALCNAIKIIQTEISPYTLEKRSELILENYGENKFLDDYRTALK
ncbi:glycosyltransferase [Pseudomonas versuta]|uniref:Glycosyl transferase family 1 domain-containing protein n=1 Tax=Pseudomonas versuta TaxID=1788301 RepID=A0ABX3E9M9_9PSED|nr:glycosyltransferase [Pseudomonas versuta]ALE88463.1 hypothetical protein AOC04_09750 [Pseudomonas versuta]OKA22398.1 hypothetical protein BOH73_08185 [Pseudomonas versuta]